MRITIITVKKWHRYADAAGSGKRAGGGNRNRTALSHAVGLPITLAQLDIKEMSRRKCELWQKRHVQKVKPSQHAWRRDARSGLRCTAGSRQYGQRFLQEWE